MFIVLFMLAVLTFTAYSASIISLLSSPSSVTTTLHGILHHGSTMGLAVFNNHYYHSYFKVVLFIPLFRIHTHTNGILHHGSTLGLALSNNHYYHSYFKVVLFIPLFRIQTHTHQWHLTSWFYIGSCSIQQSLLPFIFQGSTFYSTV